MVMNILLSSADIVVIKLLLTVEELHVIATYVMEIPKELNKSINVQALILAH
jgi:hypothetical protein